MRWAAVTAAIAVSCAISWGGAQAAEDPVPAMRADVDALVKMLAGRDPGDGPSPTARVNRLIAGGDKKLKQVLADAWRIVTTVGPAREFRPAARELVRFLYQLGVADAHADAASLVDEYGIVRARRIAADTRAWIGAGPAAGPADAGPSDFRQLISGGLLRMKSRPDVKRTLAAVESGAVAADERLAVAQALGETCSPNWGLTQDLVRRATADPTQPVFVAALAWTKRPEAEPLLRARVATFAEGDADSLTTVCRALRHVKSGALVEELNALDARPRDTALTAAGIDVSAEADRAALAKTSDRWAYNRAVQSMCARVRAARGERILGTTLASLAATLAATLDLVDGAPREDLLASAEALFYGETRGPVFSLVDEPGGAPDTRISGERLGPYPDMAAALASMAKDVADGNLVFTDESRSIFAMTEDPPRAAPVRLTSEAEAPDRSLADDSDAARSPVRISGELLGEWLRLRLVNSGASPVTIDPVAFRFVTATLTNHERYGGPAGARPYRVLKVLLGKLAVPAAVPADRLVLLAPGESYSFTVTLRREHRNVEHVCVTLAGDVAIRGTPAAPFIGAFADAWVR